MVGDIQYQARLAKHRCVRCGDQLTDDEQRIVCDTCDGANDYDSDDDDYNSPRRNQARELNALRRIP